MVAWGIPDNLEGTMLGMPRMGLLKYYSKEFQKILTWPSKAIPHWRENKNSKSLWF